MKILFVFDRPFYPIRGGAESRAITHIKYFEDKNIDYDLFLIDRYNNYSQWNREGLNYLNKSKVQQIYIHKVLGFDFDGLYRKLFVALSLLMGNIPDAASPIHSLPYTIRKFRKIVENNNYDLVFFNHTYISAALLKHTNIKCLTVIDTHDIYAILLKDMAKLRSTKKINNDYYHHKKSIMSKLSNFLFEKCATSNFDYDKSLHKEIQLLQNFDRIITISETEFTLLSKTPKIKNRLFLVPMLAQSNCLIKNHKHINEKFRLLFIGSRYDPNVDAVNSFCEKVLPFLKSSVEFIVAGGVSLVKGLTSKVQITRLGFVENLDQLYNSIDAVVLPISYGSGVSIKAIEALSYGKPIVSTKKGVRGLSVKHNQEVLIANSLEEFPKFIEALISDSHLRLYLSTNALKYINKKHSKELIYKKLDNLIFNINE